MTDNKTQRNKFEQAAHEIGTEDDPARFEERMAKLMKQRPMEKPE
jgi:hypothetical protein